MVAHLAAAWLRPIPAQGGWDFTPLIYGGVLLTVAWVAGMRLRWWSPIVALAGGLPCAVLASHFGAWAAFAVALMVFLVMRPLARRRLPG